jgi:hypothetical protein
LQSDATSQVWDDPETPDCQGHARIRGSHKSDSFDWRVFRHEGECQYGLDERCAGREPPTGREAESVATGRVAESRRTSRVTSARPRLNGEGREPLRGRTTPPEGTPLAEQARRVRVLSERQKPGARRSRVEGGAEEQQLNGEAC